MPNRYRVGLIAKGDESGVPVSLLHEGDTFEARPAQIMLVAVVFEGLSRTLGVALYDVHNFTAVSHFITSGGQAVWHGGIYIYRVTAS